MEPRQLFEQGVAQHRVGRLEQAEALYRQVLKADARNVAALHMLGFLKAQQGRYDEAITALNKAVKGAPADLTIQGHYAHALMAGQKLDQALAAYDRLLTAQPDHFEALYNRGVILSQQQRNDEALAALDRARALQPDQAAVHFSRGVVLGALERHREALESYDRALALEPQYTSARANRITTVLNLCAWAQSESIVLQEAAAIAPPLTFLGLSDDKALQRMCAQAATSRLASAPAAPLWASKAWDGRRYAHDRIRLAYVSADFRDHAVAFHIAPLIERHDRARFQVIGISTGPDDGSAIRARLAKGFDRFHDFAMLESEEIARRLREMEIDIAVDLGGHTGLNRLQVFAHRAAPVQAGWLGFAGTSGAPFLDYLIADAVVAPLEHQSFYSERLVHLPDTYFPTDPKPPAATAPARADEGLPADGFVFCAFNNAWKITRPVFDTWMRLLAQIPGSVLWLKQPAPDTRAVLEDEARARGIAPERLVFARDAGYDVHLARHRLADLFLDTAPYNAHATAVDALWAGLPVLTCKGEAFAARVAASLLGAIGLPELITESLGDYEELALALARDPARLQAVKEKLARNRDTAPLFDAQRFRLGIEDAYVSMMDAAR